MFPIQYDYRNASVKHFTLHLCKNVNHKETKNAFYDAPNIIDCKNATKALIGKRF